jgi:predicted nucleic acid-binding protein
MVGLILYVLDTNALSDLIREEPPIQNRLAGLSGNAQVAYCSIVRGEILYGITRLPQGKRRQELEEKASRIFASLSCLTVTEEAGDLYAKLKLTRQSKGMAMDENDLWIAATCLHFGATLVTRDTDFQQIDGLSVEDWTV